MWIYSRGIERIRAHLIISMCSNESVHWSDSCSFLCATGEKERCDPFHPKQSGLRFWRHYFRPASPPSPQSPLSPSLSFSPSLSRWPFAFADYTIQHGVNAERRWGSRGAVLTENSSRLQPQRCHRARAHHRPKTPTRPSGWIIRCRALVKVQNEKQTNRKEVVGGGIKSLYYIARRKKTRGGHTPKNRIGGTQNGAWTLVRARSGILLL